MTLARLTVLRSRARKRKMNSVVKSTPIRHPPQNCPRVTRSEIPRHQTHSPSAATPRQDLSPAANMGDRPSRVTLIIT